MKPAPLFRPYPLAAVPQYARWWTGGVALLAVLGSANAVLEPMLERTSLALLVGATVWAWTLAFAGRVLRFRVNRHNAWRYTRIADQLTEQWWARHRQHVGLVDAVLLTPAGSTRAIHCQLLDGEHEAPRPLATPGGLAHRLLQVLGDQPHARESELAGLLTSHWRAQQVEPLILQPARCYWQGSPAAWQAFVSAMAEQCPQVQLPEHPHPWLGAQTFDAVVDLLQGAPADTRILCAGCQSTPVTAQARLPAGEAALLWLLAAQGPRRLSRGEWFSAGQEDLAEVTARALQQAGLDAAAPCVAFAQPDIADLPVAWADRRLRQDVHFGELGDLQAMVVQTLAAWHAEQHGAPCAWLARDSQHTLTLGIAQADE